ncbi:hypothetical protein NPIL_534131 [Nephila pilipes]|uniref:Uncharacterized protein n=1 Tax=Nephila pilipes TaxID=299642 RepID=A0A8X6P8P8_NEPPI|nr:hypothetical protein NPIL_534131 [Nephila pilipes]
MNVNTTSNQASPELGKVNEQQPVTSTGTGRKQGTPLLPPGGLVLPLNYVLTDPCVPPSVLHTVIQPTEASNPKKSELPDFGI